MGGPGNFQFKSSPNQIKYPDFPLSLTLYLAPSIVDKVTYLNLHWDLKRCVISDLKTPSEHKAFSTTVLGARIHGLMYSPV